MLLLCSCVLLSHISCLPVGYFALVLENGVDMRNEEKFLVVSLCNQEQQLTEVLAFNWRKQLQGCVIFLYMLDTVFM
jgi:hypothetical protein